MVIFVPGTILTILVDRFIFGSKKSAKTIKKGGATAPPQILTDKL